MKNDHTELFANMPVPKAIITLVIPTIISQMITVVYNMADTFFSGASLISRCLGSDNRDKARKCAAFSIWTSIAAALLYGLIIYCFRFLVFPFLGTDENTYAYCSDYVLWTIGIGSVPTVLSACLAHLVRAEGYMHILRRVCIFDERGLSRFYQSKSCTKLVFGATFTIYSPVQINSKVPVIAHRDFEIVFYRFTKYSSYHTRNV